MHLFEIYYKPYNITYDHTGMQDNVATTSSICYIEALKREDVPVEFVKQFPQCIVIRIKQITTTLGK